MKKRTNIALFAIAATVAVLVGVVAVFYVVPSISIRREVAATRDRVLNADHSQVLGACRQMLATLGQNGETKIDIVPGKACDPRVPSYLQKLKPGYIVVEETNSVLVVFLGGFNHLGYRAFPESIEGNGTRKLIDGLWLISDME